MELQLQELLDRIQREGVEAAETQARKILDDAATRARALVEEAEKEAKGVVARAQAEAARLEASGKAALEQASRNLLLAFRDGVQSLVDAAVRADVAAGYGPEIVAGLIPTIVTALAKGGAEDLSVILSPDALRAIEGRYRAALATQLKTGVEIRASDQVGAGFRIAEKGGAAYYDFSAATVAEILGRHLNGKLAELLKNAARGL